MASPTRPRCRTALLLLTLLAAGHAAAQTWPARPVRWIVPFPAGGSADLMGRLIAPELGKLLGQQVVVENRAGASAIVAAEYVAKSPADGYTLLQCNVGQMSINPSLYPKLPYDSLKSFDPVTVIASVNNVMVVTPTLPARTVKEFIALAKRRPGEINFTSSGPGSLTHLTGELMKLQAGFDMVHVNYKGSAAMRERFATFGADVVASRPDDFAQYLRAETAKWGKVVRDAGVKLEQ